MPYALLLTSFLAASSSPGIAPRVRITLSIDVSGGIPVAITWRAMAEAADIWRAYGVEVTLRDRPPCEWANDNVTSLDVRAATQASTGWRAPLGAIRFSPDGKPGGVIWIYYDDVVLLAGRSQAFAAETQWPWALRQRTVARVLGRVIAHEIGHFLLRSPAHARTGLMRAVQTAQELAAVSTVLYQLSAPEALRLGRILEGETRTGPADSRPWE